MRSHSFFFFQAEDGIRDFHVTGVQTCALPIYHEQNIFRMGGLWRRLPLAYVSFLVGGAALAALPLLTAGFYSKDRSEERRVGKECRCRWSERQETKRRIETASA